MAASMIQRVARALAASGEIVISAPPNPHEGCACMGAAPGEPACRCVMAAAHVAARIAIEELREPTPEMLASIKEECVAWECFMDGGDELELKDVWREMVATALKP